jgi:outer membrane murein-binding lipoprotein Lpp
MLKKITSIIIVLAIIGMFVLTGCYKTTTLVQTPPVTQDTATISFSADIQPIFSASCALSGCHVSGAKVPNLSIGVAFQALQDGGYVVANDPDNSQLMLWLTAKKTPGMPLGNSPNPVINAKVSAWIFQGAKNN